MLLDSIQLLHLPLIPHLQKQPNGAHGSDLLRLTGATFDSG